LNIKAYRYTQTMIKTAEILIALVNIIGAILTLTGPIGVVIGLCMIFGVNLFILINAAREFCNKKNTPPPTDGE